MVTFKIFVCLLYMVYLLLAVVSGGLLIVINVKKDLKPVTRFMFVMAIFDHLLLLYFAVNYIKLIIGR